MLLLLVVVVVVCMYFSVVVVVLVLFCFVSLYSTRTYFWQTKQYNKWKMSEYKPIV